MHPQLDDFMSLFEGHQSSYGIYQLPQAPPNAEGQKQVGRAATINRKLTKEIWDLHLRGKQGLGICPINEDSMAKFGAIDVDDYAIDVPRVLRQVKDFPVVPCRTKSGGMHLYIFTKELVPAKDIQTKLREIASACGLGSCEIFPRQGKLVADRGDTGNWINLPYFNAHATSRYAYKQDGTAMAVNDFARHAMSIRVSHEDLLNIRVTVSEILQGGPPCLQKLIQEGFPNGTRNNGLFNLGVYALKSSPADWERVVESYNQRFMKPPLTAEEVLGVIKSLRRKDYAYTCKAQPIQSYCNATLCRTCQFGIGGSDLGMPKLGSLTKLATVPPIWFVDIETNGEAHRLELSTEELQSPLSFQARCMEAANVMPSVMKREQWHSLIQQLMSTVQVVIPPKGASPEDMLMTHLGNFCMGRVQARDMAEILLGKPFVRDGRVEFRWEDFSRYLERAGFKMDVNNMVNLIRSIEGFERRFRNIKGKGVNLWIIPTKTFESQTEPFDTPKLDTGPI